MASAARHYLKRLRCRSAGPYDPGADDNPQVSERHEMLDLDSAGEVDLL